jgi:gamma-glutamylcyclotransferase (GGCT)/AIG2-like uncharacterized protein YtfP
MAACTDNRLFRTGRQYLFVYGTLRKDQRSAMSRWLGQNAAYRGVGTCQGTLYNLGACPGMVSSRSPADRVTGDVYELRSARAVLKRLDCYEGNEFRRRKTLILLPNRRQLTAWIYEFRGPTLGLPRVGGGDYGRVLKKRRPR